MSRFNISENMSANFGDSGADELRNRIRTARNNPNPQVSNKSAVALHFGEDFEDGQFSPLGPDMRGYINSRRAAAENEDAEMRKLGANFTRAEDFIKAAGEAHEKKYGKTTTRLAYGSDGMPDSDVMDEIRKTYYRNNTTSHNTPLDGKMETDIAFLALKGGAKEETFIDNGVDTSGVDNKVQPVDKGKKAAAKEYILKYNKKLELPLSKSAINKVRINIDYREDMTDDDKHATITLTKVSRGGNEKSIKIEIKGEGKNLTGESFMYFFENRNDSFTQLYANLTGAAIEASLHY
jgi:hypothetical protein